MLYSLATLVRNNDQTSYAVLRSIASGCAKGHSDCSQMNSTEASGSRPLKAFKLSKSVPLDRTLFVICPVEECQLGTQFPNTLLEQLGIECRAPDSQLPI